MRLQFSCNYTIFCWMFCQECMTYKIKTSIYGFKMSLWSIIAVELTNSSAAQNIVVFQPTSEQAKYGTSDIKRLLQFSFEVNN